MLAAAGLLLVGCAEDPASTQSPTPSVPAATSSSLPFEAQTFSSPELGIAFQCPREWRVRADLSSWSSVGLASVWAMSRPRAERQAGVTLLVKSIRVAEREDPPPYMDAPLSYRGDVLELLDASGEPVSNVGFVRLDGLRLLRYDEEERFRWSDGPWPCFHLNSRHTQDPPRPTEVIIRAGAPSADWEAERETLLAILDSMRFTTPQLGE